MEDTAAIIPPKAMVSRAIQKVRLLYSCLLYTSYMILLSAVAFVIWTALLYYNPVGKITVYNFMTPVFGVILSAACLGENLWDWRYCLLYTSRCV